MTYTKAIELAADTTSRTPELPGHFLNCYEISNPFELAWPVHTYVIDRTDSQKQTHNDRGEIKNLTFPLLVSSRHPCGRAARCP